MLEDRIIVQDRGIDAGLAALMQNANKGMDPAAIPENKSVITDTNLGLTISTDKQEIVNILRNQYNTYKARKESIAKCDEEMSKCQALLEKLDIPKEPTNTEDPRIKELQDEVNELKNIIKQASSMVPPPMKQMLPQNMQNVMKEVDQ